jgi:transcription termination/antitermination protein NusA
VNRDFIGALLQLNAEKGVPREQLVHTVEDAIQSAYRRVAPGNEDVHVRLDIDTGKMRVFRARMVVAHVEDPAVEWTLDEAHARRSDAELGELVEYAELDPDHFGRVGAQIAGQVIRQRLREAERENLFDEFAHRESEIITGTVSRVEPRGVILDLGKAEAVLPTTDQSATEHYRIGQHVKAFVMEVRRTTRGPLIYVSRTHKNFLRRLFELEVPEIHAGTVEIKAIAREAGSRSKVAVASRQEGLDPVGATVGQRGGRVQAVVAELGGEKIDVIPWSDDPAVFVANALSPAQVVGVSIDEDARIASVTVPERMLSLAIGREGQNARLAAKLTGWRIDIRSDQAPPRAEGEGPPRRGASQDALPPAAATVHAAVPAAAAEPTAPAPTEPTAPAPTEPTAEAAPRVDAPAAEAHIPDPVAQTRAPAAEAPSQPPNVNDVGPSAEVSAPAVEPESPAPKSADVKRTRRKVAATEVSS